MHQFFIGVGVGMAVGGAAVYFYAKKAIAKVIAGVTAAKQAVAEIKKA